MASVRLGATGATAPDLVARLVAAEAEIVTLKAAVAELQRARGRGPRDGADDHLLEALAELIDGGDFHAADLVERGQIDPVLGMLLTEVGLTTPEDVGYWLRRYREAVVRGRVLTRIGRDDRGAVWAFS